VVEKSSTSGTRQNPGHVSGNPSAAPVVDLVGTAMERLVHAIAVAAAQSSRPVVLTGGLAVICRLGNPYRATSDVDTVDRRRNDEPSQLDLLIRTGATPSGPSGALVDTSAGRVQIDVLEITDAALDQLPDDPTGRLHVLAHNWAASTASPMMLQIQGLPPVIVQVAQAGALIAMKLQSLMDRGAAKEASDLLDIVRLTLRPLRLARRGCAPDHPVARNRRRDARDRRHPDHRHVADHQHGGRLTCGRISMPFNNTREGGEAGAGEKDKRESAHDVPLSSN
jgi:hypothetical protein